MATIYPPNNRNRIGSRLAFTWGPVVSPRILGWKANFARVLGGETVTIGAGAAAPAVITLVGGDTSALAIANRINVTFPGLASVSPEGTVLLTHATRVRVTASPNFDVIGLPVLDRNVADPASEELNVPIMLDTAEFDFLASSNYLDIPNEANKLGLFVGVRGNDPANKWGAAIALMWSNGTEGEPPFLTNGLGVGESIEDPAVAFPSGDESQGALVNLHQEVMLPVSVVLGVYLYRHIELNVPIGCTRVRAFSFGVKSTEATPYSAGNPPPVAPPTLKIAAIVGARS